MADLRKDLLDTMAAKDAEQWRGVKAFDFYVDMGRMPDASDFPSDWDDDLRTRFMNAIQYEQKRKNSKSLAEDLAVGLAEKGIDTQLTKGGHRSGADLVETIPKK